MEGLFTDIELDPVLIAAERDRERKNKSNVEQSEIKTEKKEEESSSLSYDKKLYILDGYSIIYKSYFAYIKNPIIDKEGVNVSAYYGFFSTLFSILSNYRMDYLAITMDEAKPTFRHEMYSAYKANRDKAPDDLHAQVPNILETLRKMGITVLSKPGFEADDVIASLSKIAYERGVETIIVTGDKDLCQLVKDHISVLKPPKGSETRYRLAKRDDIKEEYGVYPEQIVDYLSILGDASDNVPGIKGIGEKGARGLLSEYLTLEGVYRHLDAQKPAIRRKLEEGRENAALSKRLVTLSFEALPGELDIESLSISRLDKAKGAVDFDARGFKALKARALAGASAEEKESAVSKSEEDTVTLLTPIEKERLLGSGIYKELKTLSELEHYLKDAAEFKGGDIAIDFVTDGYETAAPLLGVGLSSEVKSAVYISATGEADDQAIISLIARYLASGSLRLIAHNAKFEISVLARYGFTLSSVRFDTMLAAWMIDSNRGAYSLDDVTRLYLNQSLVNAKDLVEKGESLRSVSVGILSRYGEENADYTFRLFRILERRLYERSLFTPYSEIELPLIPVLASMEREGIYLSEERILDMQRKTDERVKELSLAIYREAGREFNINSPQQLSKLLFEERGLTPEKKTQRGYSTDNQTLEALSSQGDPIIALILEYRQLNKLKTTYIDTLPLLRDKNGRIHTSFLQTGTATGRLSSRNPNLQNIPVRSDEGRLIRSAFVPSSGKLFLSADYSQIELVVLAHEAKDSELSNAFISGEDVHRYTASLIFAKPSEEITPSERRIAKTINFGIMYGMSSFRLSKELGISRREATDFIDLYFKRYSGIRAFVDNTVKSAEQLGYVKTDFGHIREIIGIRSPNKTDKGAAERTAVNTVIQGTAAEIMKRAMIEIDRRMRERGMHSRMILQVHDELIFEVERDEMEELKALVKSTMEDTTPLSVPLKASLEEGECWGDMH